MTSTVDISPGQSDVIHYILRKHLLPNVRVWAFGSRAKWTTHDGSDLDLAVEGDKRMDYNTLINLDIAFDDSDLPYSVDVVDLKAVSSQFKKIIDEKKVLFTTVKPKHASNQLNEVRLGSFAPFSYGKPLLAEKRDASGSVPIVGSNGIIGHHNAGLTTGHTIVIGRRGTIGAVYYVPGPCWPTDDTFYVTGNDPLLVKFKYYILQTLNLDQMSLDSAVSGLNRTVAHAKILFVPGRQEQKGIARILEEIDAKIDICSRMNKILDDMRRTLFKSWFVDFDPVRAKAGRRWKRGESLPGMPEHLYELFPDTLVDSELGKTPQGWSIKSPDDIADLEKVTALQNAGPDAGKARAPADMAEQSGGELADDKEGTKESTPPKCIVCDDEGVVFSWPLESPAKIWRGTRADSDQRLLKATSPNYPKWLYMSYMEHHLQNTAPTFQQHHHLTKAKYAVPNSEFIDSVGGIFGNMLAKKTANGRESRTLTVLRNALLPKLLSGELKTVKNGKGQA